MSNSIQDLLAAKIAAAEQNAENAKESASEMAKSSAPDIKDQEPPPTGVPTYTKVFLHQLIRRNGTKLLPVEGIYTPTCQEDMDQLEYFVGKGLVTRNFEV